MTVQDIVNCYIKRLEMHVDFYCGNIINLYEAERDINNEFDMAYNALQTMFMYDFIDKFAFIIFKQYIYDMKCSYLEKIKM